MKGLPLGVPETTNGFSKRSTGRDESTTLYHPYVIIRSVIAQKRTIDPKVGRIVTKVSREKSISQPKIKKMPQNFVPFLTAKVWAFPVHRRNFVRQIRIAFVNKHVQGLAKNEG
jgi:hypothetical protein